MTIISPTSLAFEYTDVRVVGAHPAWGPVDGGVAVLVHTRNLPAGALRCQFGDLYRDATTDTSAAVVCMKPRFLIVIPLSSHWSLM